MRGSSVRDCTGERVQLQTSVVLWFLLLIIIAVFCLPPDNPAALTTTLSQQADQGDNMTLIPAVNESEITWLHNGVALSSGDFQNSKRQLKIQNAQPVDAENYTIQCSLTMIRTGMRGLPE